MSKYEIKYSIESNQDLKDIKKYIKYDLQEPQIAEKIVKKIKNRIRELKDNPLVYSIIDDEFIKKLEIRKMVVDNYIVFYRVINSKVQIVRILYGRRNWINLL